MFSCSGSVCLLVLLGAMLPSASPVNFVSENLKKAHDLIADRLELRQPEIGSSPLFGSVIRNINTSCQRGENLQLMNATLDVYMRIFSSILQQSGGQHHHHHRGARPATSALLAPLSVPQRSKVEDAVTMLQAKMENLKHHMNPQIHNKDELLNKLNKIKVDDPMVQKKALAEFVEVFQTASVIGSHNC